MKRVESAREHGFTPSRRSAEHGFGSSWRSAEHGFTLVELLVSLLIFGMLTATGVALLSLSVRAQDQADGRLRELAAIRSAGALLTGDLAQAAPRLTRDAAGAVRPAFEGTPGDGEGPALALVRRGWTNYDGAPRPSLQKVEYRLADGRLLRTAYRHPDGAAPMEPATLLTGVRRLSLHYRDKDGQWRDRWDPVKLTELPRAVEVVVDTEGSGTIRQLFLVGAGT